MLMNHIIMSRGVLVREEGVHENVLDHWASKGYDEVEETLSRKMLWKGFCSKVKEAISASLVDGTGKPIKNRRDDKNFNLWKIASARWMKKCWNKAVIRHRRAGSNPAGPTQEWKAIDILSIAQIKTIHDLKFSYFPCIIRAYGIETIYGIYTIYTIFPLISLWNPILSMDLPLSIGLLKKTVREFHHLCVGLAGWVSWKSHSHRCPMLSTWQIYHYSFFNADNFD